MRWLKLISRYSLAKRPTLKAVNPRVGTSIIPLDQGDDHIFYQYLTNKIHSLHFEGTENQLVKIIDRMKVERGVTVFKMRTSVRKGRDKLMLLHLKLPDNHEIRRLIKLT